MKVLVISISLGLSQVSYAKAERVDWKPCKKEIEEYCTTSATDLEKHQCIEEIPKGKASKGCVEHNARTEKKLGHKHEDGHGH
jgi:hypothetical protein